MPFGMENGASDASVVWNGNKACIWIFVFEKMETELWSTFSMGDI